MKPEITVKFYPPLKDLLKTSSVIVQASDVAEVLKKLQEIFGDKFTNEVMEDAESVKNYYILFVRGEIVNQKKPSETKLKSGDILDIFPPVAGG